MSQNLRTYKVGEKVIVVKEKLDLYYGGPIGTPLTIEKTDRFDKGKKQVLHFKETNQICHNEHVVPAKLTKLEKALK